MKYKRILITILIVAVILGVVIVKIQKKQTSSEMLQPQSDYNEMKETSVMYQDDSNLEELKQEYKYTGPNNIYEINTESDGRKVINVKASMNYKVAFCGMIKNEKPNFDEIDTLFKDNYPTKSGIWILEKDRERVVEYLNNNEYTNSIYETNSSGYLKIKKQENSTDYDRNIEKLINGENQYIIAISSVCYMIEPVSGEIVDNPYNEFEEYQTYEYFVDENKIFISITENIGNKITKDEIFESIIELVNVI